MEPVNCKAEDHSATKRSGVNDEPLKEKVDEHRANLYYAKAKHFKGLNDTKDTISKAEHSIRDSSTNVTTKHLEDKKEANDFTEEVKPLITSVESLKPENFSIEYKFMQPVGTLVIHKRSKPKYRASDDKISDQVEQIKSFTNDKFISLFSASSKTTTSLRNNSDDVIKVMEESSSVSNTVVKTDYSITRDTLVGDIYSHELPKKYGGSFRNKARSEMGHSIVLTGQEFQAYSMSVRINRKHSSKTKHRNAEHTITPTKFKEPPINVPKAVKSPHPERQLYSYRRRGKFMMQQILIVSYLLFLLTGLTLAFIYYNLTSSFNTAAGWGMPILVPAFVVVIVVIDVLMESILIMRSIFFGFILSIAAVLLNALLYSSLGINRQTRIFYIGFIDLSFIMFITFVLSFFRVRYNRSTELFTYTIFASLIVSFCSSVIDRVVAATEMEKMERFALYLFNLGYILFTTAEISLIAHNTMQVYTNDFVYAGFIVYIGIIDLPVRSLFFLVNQILKKKT